MPSKDRKKQADAIMRFAEESGVAGNYLFETTFERYQVQLKILDELEKALGEEGMLVSKEYVKGRKNLYANPAVTEFNRTTDSANKTASTLMKIIRSFAVEDNGEADDDPLMSIIGGDENDEQ